MKTSTDNFLQVLHSHNRAHTAVKISPKYSQPTIHVLDASKSVVVTQALLDEENREELIDEVKEEYEEIREEYKHAIKVVQFSIYYPDNSSLSKIFFSKIFCFIM